MTSPAVVAVIEDDEFVRSAIASLLHAAGIDFRAFPSATTFLAEARARDFRCIVSDLQMPGMSGLELLETLRRDGEAPPFVLITAFSSKGARAAALAGGARAFLEKPIDGAALLAILVDVLAA